MSDVKADEQIITPPDSTTSKEPPLFVVTDSDTESPSSPSPLAAPVRDTEKRGRGRPRKDSAKVISKSKTESDKAQADVASAVAVANAGVVVGALDLLRAAISGGDCPESPELRDATLQAWAAYLKDKGAEIPAWVQVAIISTMYVAPALKTETGKSRVSSLWAKAKGWWIARRG